MAATSVVDYVLWLSMIRSELWDLFLKVRNGYFDLLFVISLMLVNIDCIQFVCRIAHSEIKSETWHNSPNKGLTTPPPHSELPSYPLSKLVNLIYKHIFEFYVGCTKHLTAEFSQIDLLISMQQDTIDVIWVFGCKWWFSQLTFTIPKLLDLKFRDVS